MSRLSNVFPPSVAWLLALAVVLTQAVSAQEAEEDDFPPGLLARYTAPGRTIERIDPDVAFDWESESPDARLPAGPFSARWSSLLLIREPGDYVFHAYVQGQVSVELDGKTVLEGRRDEPGWISGTPIAAGFGEKALEIAFDKTAETAQLRLFWSSNSFSLEPVPDHLLFRETGRPDLARIERGRLLYDVHRCNRCHRRENETPSSPGPSLVHVSAGADADWLIEKLQAADERSPHARMPAFGFSAGEARAVAAFLWDGSQDPKFPKADTVSQKDAAKFKQQGDVLLRSLGCLACHQVGRYGNAGDTHSGGDLSHIGRKRSYDWLFHWLGQPEKLNPDHRMPVFKLSKDERRQLALALSALGRDDAHAADATNRRAARNQRGRASQANEKLIAQGRQLVQSARCAACHQIPGVEADLNGLPDLAAKIDDWSNSCLPENDAAKADRKTGRPVYAGLDRRAIIDYVDSRTGPLSPESRFDLGRQVLERRNCFSCHERNQDKGLRDTAGLISRTDDRLKGQSSALIPPRLTAVGDKLLDDALVQAVSGRQEKPRMPWLHVRMPVFQHSEEEQSALLHHLIAHDRIPDGAPAEAAGGNSIAGRSDDSEILLAGHTLVGAKGFSCIACHDLGEYKPRNVALGTRGSDLLMLGKRMRQPFFVRWTRSPLRIVPGMEMPSYTKAVPGVLNDDVDAQLAAAWEALNDPRFTVPTNPTAVEQFWAVRPGEPARIVRDVFTHPEENGGGYLARVLAVGLNNGHNLAFDLENFGLASWTFGDFARQRTAGKSWYWDMAGVPVISGFPRQSDLALLPRDKSNAEPLLPMLKHSVKGWPESYRSYRDGVEFRYRLHFEIQGREQTLDVTETILPVARRGEGERGGWERRIEAAPVPQGFQLLVGRPVPQTALGNPVIERKGTDEAPWKAWRNRQWSSLPDDGNSARGVLHYLCSLQSPELELKPLESEQPAVTRVTSTPGFEGLRLPLTGSIMPTALAWASDGALVFTSLKGHVYKAYDSNRDGLEDRLTLIEEGLAAPYGIIADGDDLLVTHKPEMLRLIDTTGDGRADVRQVAATGWGYTDDYHDWTCGIVRDGRGNVYVGLASDYAQSRRDRSKSRWRGKILQIGPQGEVTPIAHALRYPTGFAVNADGEIFVSDNQGVQNTFNEINHVIAGRHYGVPSLTEEDPEAEETPPAVRIPHPWTRSVNGIFFLPQNYAVPAFAGHGIGCEYDLRLLIRFTLQRVGDAYQGATYYFSRPDAGSDESNFNAPLCGGVSPEGDIYIGSIFDSGWLGGRNTGDIVRLRPQGELPNGIAEVQARSDGFSIRFIRPADAAVLARNDNYNIQGYTREWQGGYYTPDSGRHKVEVEAVAVSDDAQTVVLKVDRLRAGYVYEVTCNQLERDSKQPPWPATGHYTMNRIPE